MSNPIYVIDQLVVGNLHIMFNASITEILSRIYFDKKLVFYAESEHLKIIKGYNKTIKNIEYKPNKDWDIKRKGGWKAWRIVSKKIADIQFIRNLLRNINPNEPAYIYISLVWDREHFSL